MTDCLASYQLGLHINIVYVLGFQNYQKLVHFYRNLYIFKNDPKLGDPERCHNLLDYITLD